ncbi:MAG: choice-of-anchor L domain-containing protein [Saprospiraceae bacterium]|nr:choice-of-anchor L domain-containing protein [Saprospiraceae bacterium]
MNRITGLFQKLLLSVFLFFFLTTSIRAQLMQATGANTPPFTPQNLISNIFLGDGVEVTNVTFNGNAAAIGYFTGATQAIGIDRGIVMTTGRVESTGGLFGSVGCTETGVAFASTDNFIFTNDPDLAALTNGVLRDLAIYTITFIPTDSLLSFRYCFASEEYPEYSCNVFNDVFGFFISGPNPAGGNYTNTNIARIPGTALPVAINTIHPFYPPNCAAVNAQYYNNNDFSNKQPTYDGFTDVFTAEAKVIPCQSYTIKLAIADVTDGIYDSGVFLEAKSFGTGSLRVEVTTTSLDGAIVEGCAAGTLTFKVPNVAQQNIPIDYNVWGTATNGVDYQTIPSGLFIPAGQSQVTVPLIAFEDNMAEGDEFIVVDVQRDPCNRDTIYIAIKDNGLVKPSLRPDTTLCVGAPAIELDGTLPISLPAPPSFTNQQDFVIQPTNVPVFSPINVVGVQPTVLQSGVIRSVCLNITHAWVDDLDIFLIAPGGQFLELSTDNGGNGDNYTNTCFTETAATIINFPGPFAPASAAPFTGDWLPEGVWSDLWGSPTNGNWRLQIIDDANGIVGTLRDWTITFEPSYRVDYQWSPTTGLSNPTSPVTTANPTQPTTYTIVATDSYGCTVTDSIAIDVQTPLPAPVVTCGGSSSSTITFDWANVAGVSGYQINVGGQGWVPVGNVNTYLVENLPPSSAVTLQVQGIGGTNVCDPLIGTVTCFNCSPPTATTAATSVSCFGGSDGSVSVVPDGANPPYTFKLGAQTSTTGIFQNLTAGLHIVTLTDATGCSVDLQVTVGSPSQCIVETNVLQNVSCFGGNNGSASASATGGTPPYTFVWSAGGQTTPTVSNLSAGTYTVTVTDANGCTSTATATVTQPADLALSALGSFAKCFGEPSGAATASAMGGVAPYNFVWSNGVNGTTNPNLLAGNYFVTVTDANNCAETAFVTIGQPPQLAATIATLSVKCAGGADGSATVTVTGGVGPYTYKWSDSAGQTTPTASNLSAQDYSVTTTDANGCTLVTTASVLAPPPLSAVVSNTNALCNGGTATANATPSGGTGPYTYKWSDAAGQTTATANNLLAGNYTVTITDQNGCTLTNSVSIFQPEAIQLTATVQNVTCFGGSNGQITAQPSGGVAPFTFLWSSNETTAAITGKMAGGYTVTATDANGCTAVLQETITVPTEVLLNVNTSDIKCFGENNGTISAAASGGTPGYAFAWSGPNNFASTLSNLPNLIAGTYNLTLTDNAGCTLTWTGEILQPDSALTLTLPAIADTICFQASNGTATVVPSGGTSPYTYLWDVNAQTTQTVTGLASAPYKVTVTDANGCTKEASTAVVQKEELFAFVQGAPPPCFNQAQGTATVTAVFYGANNADISAFSYTWSTVPIQTGFQATGLQPLQTYSVTVTDKEGCTAVQSASIGNALEFFANIQTFENVKCFGDATGSATAGAIGGVQPYSFTWSAGSPNGASTQNLAAGTYRVTVTDVNNCQATTTVTIAQPPQLQLDIVATPAKCFGESNGSAKAIPSGGTPPYTYLWWVGGHQTQEISGLPAGSVGLTLIDANGCQTLDSALITQPASPVGGTAEKRDPKCHGGRDGEITISATGGTPPYRYTLDDKPYNGSPKQISIGAGVYTPKVMDKNGCVFVLPPIEVNQRPPLQVELGPDITIELGESTQLIAEVLNAVGAVTYAWNPKDSIWLSCLNCPDPFVDSLYYQNYFDVRVKDSLGCVAEDRIRVVVEKPRRVFVPTGFTPNGDFNNDLLLVHGQISARVLTFRVFDRWGELVYEAGDFQVNDDTIGWDGTFRGKPMDPGVFVWVLEVQYMDGAKEVLKGNTTLIR